MTTSDDTADAKLKEAQELTRTIHRKSKRIQQHAEEADALIGEARRLIRATAPEPDPEPPRPDPTPDPDPAPAPDPDPPTRPDPDPDPPIQVPDPSPGPGVQFLPVSIAIVGTHGADTELIASPPMEMVREVQNGIGFEWAATYVHSTLSGIGLRAFWARYDNAPDAVEVTFFVENGQEHNGCVYFEQIIVVVGGKEVNRFTRSDLLLPRGLVGDRVVYGEGKGELISCSHLPVDDHPDWAPAQCQQAIDDFHQRASLGGLAKPMFNGFHDLGDSHGGVGISPSDGEWTKFKEGWQFAWLEMLAEISRCPLLVTDEEGQNKFISAPYWCGRTTAHQLDAYKDIPQGSVVGHGPELYSYKPHDYTHLWRAYRKAAMLAPYSPAARWWIGVVWHDLTLWLESGGADSDNRLLWPLQKLVDTTDSGQGAWWGGRGLAHTIRCFLHAEPWMPELEATSWRSTWLNVLGHIAFPNGVTLVDTSGRWQWARAEAGVDSAYPMSRGFETMLMLHNYAGLNLDLLLDNARTELPTNLADVFSPTHPNTVRSNADCYPSMNGLWRVEGIPYGYPNSEQLVIASSSRGGPLGSSQDLDRIPLNTYRHVL